MRQEKAKSSDVRVHVLMAGRAICGFTKAAPAQWPAGHLWVNFDGMAVVTCSKCQRLGFEEAQRQQARETKP